jgi:hypothetical protein
MRDQWVAIDRKLLELDPSQVGRLDDLLNEQVDSLLYLNDIFDIDVPEVSFSLGDSFLRLLALPLVAGSLGAKRRLREHLGLPTATYFLVQIFAHIKHSPVINTLLTAMFMPLLQPSLHAAIQGPPPAAPPSYTYQCCILDSAPSEVLRRSERVKESLMVEFIDEGNESTEPNSVRDIFLSYLRSKDNNLILLTLLVLQEVLSSSAVNQRLLSAAGLMPQRQTRKQVLLNSILDQPELSEDSRPRYDISLMDALLKLFDTEPIFRTATYRLTVKLVILLAYREDVPQCLLPEHELALDRAFRSVLLKLKRMLISLNLSDLFMEYFEEEWLKASRFTLSERTPCPALLLVPTDDEVALSIPLHMRLPVGEVETARCLLAVFFSMRLLRFYMLRQEAQVKAYPFSYSRPQCSWLEGQVQQIGSQTLVRCTQKEGRSEVVKYLVEDESHFIIVEPDPSTLNSAKVNLISHLRSVEAMFDRSDPRTLVVAVKRGKDGLQFMLTFEDPQSCLRTKRAMEERRRQAKEEDLALVLSYFGSIEQSFQA